MNHAQLKAFHAVAKFGGITSAAKSLGVTQPAVTLQIQALEKKYQTPLFNRQGHTITLTPAGLLLHNLSSRYFTLEEEAHTLLSSIMNLKSGKLRIASDIPHRIFPITEPFREKHSGVELSVAVHHASHIATSLSDRLVDIAITGTPLSLSGVVCCEIGSEPISATVPVSHPLAAKASISYEHLSAEKILVFGDGNAPSSLDEKIISHGNIAKTQVISFNSREMVPEAVAHNQGVAFLSKHEIDHDCRLKSIPIDDCFIRRKEFLHFHDEQLTAPAVSAFRDFFVKTD